MTSSANRSLPPRRGFSLIEVLIASAIGALILTALTFHLFSFATIWSQGTEDTSIVEHVDGVSQFLRDFFEHGASGRGGGDGIVWEKLPGSGIADPFYLRVDLAQVPPFLTREGPDLPPVRCYLRFEEGSGLSLIWYSLLQESEIDDANDLFASPISQFVVRIEYCYYSQSDEEWVEENEPLEDNSNQPIMPDYLRFHFEYQDEEYIRHLYLPEASRSLPLF